MVTALLPPLASHARLHRLTSRRYELPARILIDDRIPLDPLEEG